MTNNRGIAMFLVLWVLALLSVIVGEYCYTMRTEVNITRNAKDGTQAYYLAEAGFKQAVYEIVAQKAIPPKAPPVGGDSEETMEEMTPEWRVNVDIPRKPFAGGYFKVRIENESGRININYADEALLKLALGAFELDDTEKSIIVDSIMDWRDVDDLHRLNGAEDKYYQALPEPYDCKNGPFNSVEELLLVRGVTPELFYEKGLKNFLTAGYFGEQGRPSPAPASTPVAAPVTTPTPAPRQTNAVDFNKVNINAVPAEILLAFPQVDVTIIDAIRQYRMEKDFQNLAEVATVVGPDAFKWISPHITTSMSDYFTIESLGMVEGSSIRHTLKALIQIDFAHKKNYKILQWVDATETSRELESDLIHEISDSGS